MSCPSEDSVQKALESPAHSEARRGLLQHISVCTPCRALVAVTAEPGGGDQPVMPRMLNDGLRVAGRYTIERFIAAGGMGEVYQAYDDLLDESVALKTIGIALSDDRSALDRFKSEVQLAQKVTHRNVCRVYDAGLVGLADGFATPFLTMELLRGQSLADSLRQKGPMHPAQLMPVVRDVLAGLSAIHAAGIVHRDLKPENVFLVPGSSDESVVAKLMDFGLARPIDLEKTRAFSSQSVLKGTPDYMAPEQLRGGPGSAASDLYALGTIIFRSLTGRLPFNGDSAIAAAMEKLTITAPRLAGLLPNAAADLAQVADACLARTPERRPLSADAAKLMLERRPAASRRPYLWLAAVVVVAGFGATWSFVAATSPPQAAQDAAKNTSRFTPTPASAPEASRRLPARHGPLEEMSPNTPEQGRTSIAGTDGGEVGGPGRLQGRGPAKSGVHKRGRRSAKLVGNPRVAPSTRRPLEPNDLVNPFR